jgi:hypothetical protein
MAKMKKNYHEPVIATSDCEQAIESECLCVESRIIKWMNWSNRVQHTHCATLQTISSRNVLISQMIISFFIYLFALNNVMMK